MKNNMREPRMHDTVESFIGFVWATLVLGICVYVVFWLGHSGWWFLLALWVASSWKTDYRKELELKYPEND